MVFKIKNVPTIDYIFSKIEFLLWKVFKEGKKFNGRNHSRKYGKHNYNELDQILSTFILHSLGILYRYTYFLELGASKLES